MYHGAVVVGAAARSHSAARTRTLPSSDLHSPVYICQVDLKIGGRNVLRIDLLLLCYCPAVRHIRLILLLQCVVIPNIKLTMKLAALVIWTILLIL